MNLAQRLFFTAVTSFLIFFATACSSLSTQTNAKNNQLSNSVLDGKESVLTREQAMYRARQIGNMTYNLWFGLDEEHLDFQERSIIRFELKPAGKDLLSTLRLDFTGGTIQSLVINEKSWDADKIQDRYDGRRIELKTSELIVGQNRIQIAYAHPFSKTGNGLYRFQDPLDQKIYLFSHFEPYYANQVFPCFDQPDLKASFEVTVDAPKDWSVISNMKERSTGNVDGKKSWQFPPSPVYSTYLFALHAGPYHSWKSDANGIPLRLFARDSLAKHLDTPEWFNITKKGLAFYGEYFGVPYPYGKYDQILVPDFNAGAMENVGAVTFSEKFIYQSRATEEDRKDRADTILHEMAHMWFGDLVTMRWWNGLWLNESFATYLSSVALERTKLYNNIPQSFYYGVKGWAYHEDSLVTTHPIESSVADTSVAFSNFDGITYGKGASTLKQLHFMLGDEDFQEGLHRYFKKYANRNTALIDFIHTMGHASSQDLTHWQKSWLMTTGMNRIQTNFQCDETKKISEFKILQSGDVGNPLRLHKTKIALYKEQSGKLVKNGESLTVSYDGPETNIDELIGLPCPDFVFPNDGDFDYVKIVLDPVSLKTVLKNLSQLQDPLTRHMLWQVLWDQVRDGELTVTEYIDAAITHLAKEKSKIIVEDMLPTLAQANPRQLSVVMILPPAERPAFLKKWHALAKKMFERSPVRSDEQKLWFESALQSVYDEPTAQWALDIATGKTKIAGIHKDLENEWKALIAAARLKPLAQETLDNFKAKDPSEEGKTFLWAAVEASPTSETDLRFSSYFLNPSLATDPDLKPARLRDLMRSYLSIKHEERIKSWKDRYFLKLSEIVRSQDDTYASDFANRLFPSYCSNDVIESAKAWLLQNKNSSIDVIKEVKKGQQKEERCVRARKLVL